MASKILVILFAIKIDIIFLWRHSDLLVLAVINQKVKKYCSVYTPVNDNYKAKSIIYPLWFRLHMIENL